MNYAAFKLGTWYPMGGFGKMIDAFKSIALEKGVTFHTSEPVEKLNISNGRINTISTFRGKTNVDAVIGAADYNHIEQKLLESQFRQYSPAYWDKRVMAPSSLLFYLGVNKKIKKLDHHNLFFDADYDTHADEIYVTRKWPEDPLFYVCCPSVTDPSVAPAGMENIFILMPLAPGVNDEDNVREKYFDMLLTRLEKYAGEEIRNHIVYKKSYCVSDFVSDYNAYKGNAYGLANTLKQTAILKPKIASKKVKNLFYAGQLTVPGPGVPPSIISGEIASAMLLNKLNS
jgi:phytoene desaturase